MPKLTPTRREYLDSFLWNALVALGILLPFMLLDKGFFLYCGDFNSQQIPFYQYGAYMLQRGQIGYSWASDLGGSFINTYSFYMAGSPFFWITALLPNRLVPYMMAPLLALKFGTAGFASYGFLRRYAKNHSYALFGSMLYSFSGFAVYNIFFNHFVDVIAFFPFMLWAMDGFIYENKRGFFALAIALNLLNNQYFFVGQVVFLLLWFGVKWWHRSYQLSWKKFGLLFAEAVMGCCMGVLLAWPAALSLAQNPRSFTHSEGWGLLLYGRVQQYFAIFASAFFPPDPPYLPNLFTDANVKWTSLSVYLPLTAFSGVLAYYRSGRRSWLRTMMTATIVMAFVPLFNSFYYLLNNSYYARWFYMPIILFALATMIVLQDETMPLQQGILTALGVTLAFSIFGLVPQKVSGKLKLGVMENTPKFWLTICTALLGLLLFYVIVRQMYERPGFFKRLFASLMAFTVLYSIVHLSIGRFPQWEVDADFKQLTYDAAPKLKLPTDTFYRFDAYNGEDNLGLHFHLPGIQFFNSTVSPSIMEFYPYVGVTRDVSSKPDLKNFALRGLLSVRYLLVPETSRKEVEDKALLNGFQFVRSEAGYGIYENPHFVPMGFTYDYYITKARLDAMSTQNRQSAFMKAIGLSQEQEAKYKHLLAPLPEQDALESTFDDYVQDSAHRRATAAKEFVADHKGFTARIVLPKENLVFFSVPYDKGFTATVNGKPAPVEKVSSGLLAVPAPAGESRIEMRYRTPGLNLSMALTALGWAAFAGYILLTRQSKKQGAKAPEKKEARVPKSFRKKEAK